MPWNQSGSGDKDPWGQGNGQNQPPDLDEVLKDIQKRFSGYLEVKAEEAGNLVETCRVSVPKRLLPSPSLFSASGLQPVFMWLSRASRQSRCDLALTRRSRKLDSDGICLIRLNQWRWLISSRSGPLKWVIEQVLDPIKRRPLGVRH